MENKKYELTDETIVSYGCTLHRIRALKDFADVKAGDLGGLIEKEGNLSQDGECWVCGDARVYDRAWVFGDAWVCGDARVYNDAQINFCFVLKTGSFGGKNDKNDLFMRCPQKGSFTAFKKVGGGLIAEIAVPKDAKRSSAGGSECRCDKAKVVALYNPDGSKSDVALAKSKYDETFVYEVGKTAKIKDFDDNRWNECSTGIHFFMSFEEARDYVR